MEKESPTPPIINVYKDPLLCLPIEKKTTFVALFTQMSKYKKGNAKLQLRLKELKIRLEYCLFGY